MQKPIIKLTKIAVKGNIATAMVKISCNSEGKRFDSFGTLTYTLDDPEYFDAPVETIEPVIRGYVLIMLNNCL